MRLTRTYPVARDDVWRAITSSERSAAWLGTFTGSGGSGGTVELTITGEVDAGGEVAQPVTVAVHECAAPHRLVVEVPSGDGSWTIALELARTSTGTAVELVQDLPAGTDEASVEAGWSWYLDRLGSALTGAPKPDWAAYAPS